MSISADVNTAIVYTTLDHNFAGAAWVYTRSEGCVASTDLNWSVLVQSAPTSIKVRLMHFPADGITAIVCGSDDSPIVINGNSGGSVGAAWVFTRSGRVRSKQGPKLVGTGAIGGAEQGYSVSLSADWNTAIVRAFFDDNQLGAACVFTRSGGVWSQQGPKLVGKRHKHSFQQTTPLRNDGYHG